MKNRNISFEYPKIYLLKSSYPKKILAKIFLPKKIPKSKISNPPKSFDPGHLKSGVPPPPPELKLQKIIKSIS